MEQHNRSARDAVVTEYYRLGALSYRQAKPDIENPYQPETKAFCNWKEGHRNEQLCLHIVEGVDIISGGFDGPISLSVAPSLQLQPRKTYLAYAHELMITTSMYARAALKIKERPFITALQLQKALAAEGDVLSADFANLIRARINLDEKMSGSVLTEDDVRSTQQATATARNLVLAIGRIQNCYYDRLVRNDVIARVFGKPPEWTAKMLLCSVRRGGLSSSVQFSRQTCTLTPKGWSTVRLMQQPGMSASADNSEMHESHGDEFGSETPALSP